jgi:hypothetical protein
MTALAGTTATAAEHNTDTRKIVARGSRATDSSATTGITAVLRLDDIPIIGGRLYEIKTSSLHLDSTVIDDHIEARITYTTDGTTPTSGSTILPGAKTQGRQSVSASFGEDRVICTLYAPATDETLSLLLCVRRDSGTGSVSIGGLNGWLIDMWVTDMGEDPGNTGTSI